MFRRSLTALVALALVVLGFPFGYLDALASDGGTGTVSLTAIGATYSQDLNSLTNSPEGALTNVLPLGWMISESGTSSRNDGKYAVGTGSSNTGDIYAYGTVGNAERALGTLRSGTLVPIVGASFINNTGSGITKLDLAYTGEQWRLGTTGRGSDRLDFEYSLDAVSLTTGSWVGLDALDFTGPISVGTVGLLNGNVAANRTTVAASIFPAAPIANGSSFWIRWTDFDPTGADDGLAVDDFSLTPLVADAPPSVTVRSPAPGATAVARDSNVTIGFSEAVALGADWFDITCADSGAHPATATGSGPNTYVLNPATDFGSNEICTVTVKASLVTDIDPDDPPNNMAADDVFTFRTAEVLACGTQATLIHEVQGSGDTSPIAGNVVAVEGVVIGDYQQAGGFNGFFVQEEAGDADTSALTSEGIFVFTAFAAGAGDVVRLRGTVTEFAGLTEITSVNALTVCSTGASVPPTPVSLPVANVTDLERFEGMLVSFDQTLTATEVFNLGRFGEVSLSGVGRLYTPTAVAAPGAAAQAVLAQNNRSRIILDDGDNQQNIDPTRYPQGGLSAANTLRVGDTLSSLIGILDFRFGAYRIQPIGPLSWIHTNPRTTTPPNVGGNLRVASFNVLNFFNGNGMGGGFPTSRGAETAFELQRQLAKEVSALIAIDADIVGLMEIENDAAPHSAIEDLVAALNAAIGPGTYSFINTGVIGTDEIKVALIYKPGAVTPVGAYKTLTSAVDPRFIDTLNRPSLAQTFEDVFTGQKLTVVVNHLKSKGSACNGDPDIGDGQGNCNLTRTTAAAALASWLATDPTGSGDPDFLIIGDLNSYTFENPVTTLTTSGYTNLVRQFDGLAAYSYVFNGESGYLDHAFASQSLVSQVTDVADWHINPDEPTVLDYNTNFKTANQVNTFYSSGPYRSSDHDPVIIGLHLATTAGTFANVEGAPAWPGGIRTKVNVNGMSGEAMGRVLFESDSHSYEATRIDSIVATGADATIFGAFGSVTFRLDIHDGGSVDADTLRLRTSDGFDSGVLTGARGQLVVNTR